MKPIGLPNFETTGLLNHLEWIKQLSKPMDRIVTFGCVGSEPFALLWILGSTQVTVVEKKADHLIRPKEELELLKRQYPDTYKPGTVKFITADMSKPLQTLFSNFYDLAFCEAVLKYIKRDTGALQRAVNQMARVIKPGKWALAIEQSFESDDMDKMFCKAGLQPYLHIKLPRFAYCYQKPES
ncbi:MAG: methyltransferase domain-containing protein [Chloroflexota bacterium]